MGHVHGAPVVLAPSWGLGTVLLTWLFAPTVQARRPDLGAAAYLVSLLFVVVLFGSVLVHELAHGATARARGMRVREYGLTLWGGQTVFTGAATTPGTSALVAVTGPLANVVLGLVFWLLARAVDPAGLLGLLAWAAAFTNGFVGLFNLVPALPLDGGRVLEAGVWAAGGDRRRGTIVAAWAGRALALVVVVGVLGGPFLAGSRPQLFDVVWAAVLGAVLWSGAGAALRDARTGRAVADLTVARVGRRAVAVPVGASVADADRVRTAAGAVDVVVLAPDGRPAAVVDPGAAAGVPLPARPSTPVASVAAVLPVGAVLDAGLAGPALVDAVGRASRTSPVLVALDHGQVVAVVRVADVVAALQG